MKAPQKAGHISISSQCENPRGSWEHLYSKVGIMLKYKNMEKELFFTKRHTLPGVVLRVSKTTKNQEKGMFC